MKDKIENIFKSYPDIKVSEFKFLIDDLVELYAEQEEIKKEIIEKVEDIMGDTLSADTPNYHKEVDSLYKKLEKL